MSNNLSSNTTFGPKKIHFLPECRSTNDEAWAGIEAGRLGHGWVVRAGHQSAGRGQGGNAWLSAPNVNLLCSLIVRPAALNGLEGRKLFRLTQLAAVALQETVLELTGCTADIKWPNDLYVGERKLSGILTESRLQGDGVEWAVVGLGLNVNQQEFGGLAATSLAVLAGRAFEVERVLEVLLSKLKGWLGRVRLGADMDELSVAYRGKLLRREGTHRFYRTNGEDFEASLHGVSGFGQLELLVDGVVEVFDVREVGWWKGND